MKKILINTLVLILVGLLKLNSQPSQPNAPSADVYNYSKYADVNADLYTGAMSENIGIGSVNAGPLSTSASINYYFAGHRPSDLASPIGLGFHLAAGGAITRRVQGLDDFDPEGWYYKGDEVQSAMLTNQQLTDVANGDLDPQSDIYSLQADGISIKFAMDDMGVCYTIPRSDIKIEYKEDISYSSRNYFQMTTTDGTKYRFGGYYSDLITYVHNIEYTNFDSELHISAWYLSKVETHDGLNEITYEYEDHDYNYYSLQDCEIMRWDDGNEEGTVGADCEMTAEQVTINGKLLNKINGLASSIEFNYSTTRDDLLGTPKKLQSIYVKTGGYTKTFTLYHDYFTDGDLTDTQVSNHLGLNNSIHNTLKKKLRLDRISTTSTDGSIPDYEFDYYGVGGTTTTSYPTYSILNKAYDGYGFVNGKFANNDKDHIIPYSVGVSEEYTITFGHGADIRDSDGDYSIVTALRKLKLPTGGEILYEYEPNCHLDISQNIINDYFLFANSNCNAGNTQDTKSITLSTNQINNGKIVWSKTATCTNGYEGIIEIELKQGSNPANSWVFANAHSDGELQLNTVSPPLQPGNYTFKVIATDCEANAHISYVLNGSEKETGGIRLSKKTIKDGLSNDIIRNVEYVNGQGNCSGRLYKSPTYVYPMDHLTHFEVGNVLFSTASILPYSSYEGHHMGYEESRILYNGSGRQSKSYYTDLPVVNSSNFPPIPEQNRSLWGQVKSDSIIREDDEVLQRSTYTITPTEYGHEIDANMHGVRRLQVRTNAPSIVTVDFQQDYKINTGTFRPSSALKSTEGIESCTEFLYGSPQHLFANDIKEIFDNGDLYRRRLRYTIDTLPGAAYDSLISRNIILPSIDLNQINNESVVESTQTYSVVSGHPRPYQNKRKYYDINNDNDTETDDYLTYNSNGLLTKYKAHGDLVDNIVQYNSNRLITSYGPLGLTISINYHSGSNLISSIEEVDGTTTTFIYDGLMRLKRKTLPTGAMEEWVYDISDAGIGQSKIKTTSTFPPDANNLSSLLKLENFNYLDGLGRTKQNVEKAQTPNGKDRVSVMTYNNQGQIKLQYEAIEGSASDGSYYSNLLIDSFTLFTYEASPLFRPISVSPPNFGDVTKSYGTNTVTITGADGMNYNPGTLLRRAAVDGNGNQHISYTELQGRTVVSRRSDALETSTNDVKYDYDWQDRVIEVVPPGSTLANDELNFIYEYDKEGKTIKKKIPSTDSVEMAYDSRDLLIGYKDGHLRANGGKWYVYEYDNFSREIKSGFGSTSAPSGSSTSPSDVLTEISYGITSTNRGKITQQKSKILDTGNFITVNTLYDGFGRAYKSTNNNILRLSPVQDETTTFFDGSSSPVKSVSKVYDNNSVLTTITNTSNIDDDGRLTKAFIQLNSLPVEQLCQLTYTYKDQLKTKYQGGTVASHLQKIDYKYLDNNVLHKVNEGESIGGDLFGYQLNYNTDFAGWNPGADQLNGNIKSTSWKNVGENILIQHYDYDYLDRLKKVETGEKTSPNIGNATNVGYLNTEYEYDARGNFATVQRKDNNIDIDNLVYYYGSNNANQLSHITDGGLSDRGYKKANSNVYAYDENGNMTNDPQKGITTVYNHLNLAKSISWTDGRKMQLSYDADGNLHRRQLLDEDGNVIRTHDYLGPIEYIDGLKYCVMHSEGRIVNEGVEDYLDYLYLDHQQDKDGLFEAKLIESTGKIEDAFTDYEGSDCVELQPGFEVASGAEFLAHIETPPTYQEDWRIEYDILDHLGNLRLSYSDTDDNNTIDTTTEILQKQDYYAYGMPRKNIQNTALRNSYMFNGMDNVHEFDLDLSMTTFRNLDSGFGGWTGVDPKAESMHDMSPYCAMNNNPISFTDPKGDIAFVPILIGVGIGAAVHTGAHLATNKFTLNNWNWGSFAGSVVAGGIGGGISSALTKAGLGGFAGGSITGGASGFSQNFTNGLINGNLTLGGLVKSTFSGASIGGFAQGISAAIDGRRFWDGSKLLSTTTLANDPNVKAVKQLNSHDCGPACIESIDPRYTQTQVRGWHGGNPNSQGIGDNTLWKDFSLRSGRKVQVNIPNEGLVDQLPGVINRGRSIALNIKSANSAAPGHSVIMKSIARKTYQKVNGQIISKLSYSVMNPARGIFTNISRGSIMGAHKIFIIRP